MKSKVKGELLVWQDERRVDKPADIVGTTHQFIFSWMDNERELTQDELTKEWSLGMHSGPRSATVRLGTIHGAKYNVSVISMSPGGFSYAFDNGQDAMKNFKLIVAEFKSARSQEDIKRIFESRVGSVFNR